jgi:hypothetical protein
MGRRRGANQHEPPDKQAHAPPEGGGPVDRGRKGGGFGGSGRHNTLLYCREERDA